jgi:cytochrome P450
VEPAVDVWPISHPLLAVFEPTLISQFTQDQSQEKHPQMRTVFRPFTSATDLVTTEGQEWKTGRAIFNPGFSSRNLLSLIPSFVEDALVFRNILGKFSTTEEVITLVDFTTNLTVDIIGRAVL